MAIDPAGGLRPVTPETPPFRGPAASRPDPAGSARAELDALLTSEERAYFAELERLGSLSYGRSSRRAAAEASPRLGQRVDTRA